MKRFLALLVSLCLAVSGLTVALAAGADSPLAYIGPDERLYLTSSQNPLFNQKVTSVICQTADSAYVISELSNGTTGLIRVNLSSGFATLAAVVDPQNCVPSPADNSIYYLDASGTVLMRLDLSSGAINTATPLSFTDAYIQTALTGVRAASYSNDLISYVYTPGTGLVPSDIPGNCVYQCFDTMETVYTDLNGFLARCQGEALWRSVVNDYAWPLLETDGKLVYLTELQAGGKTFTVVHIYDPAMSYSTQLSVLENGFFKTGAVVDNKLYLADLNGQLISVDMTSGVSTSVHYYGSEATGIEIRSAGDFAAVYNLSEDGLRYLARTTDYSAAPTYTPPTIITDPTVPSLQIGSKGEAVRRLQQTLSSFGYPAGTADGTYGQKTAAAVKYLQSQLGLPETGVADSYIQQLVTSGSIPTYSPYAALKQGDISTRVAEMQARLSALGYFANAQDGEYGPFTRAAVVRFQAQNHLPVTGDADSETLQRIYATDAPYCLSYFDLQAGNSGYAVSRLQQRLRSLGYYEGTINAAYDNTTAQAVKFAQRDLSLTDNGIASASFQQTVFASTMPPAGQYVILKKGDTSQRVYNLVDRLINMGYFNGDKLGYTYGDKTFDAVNVFASVMGMPSPNGVATVAIQSALFASSAPMNPHPPAGNPHADPYADPEHTTYLDLDTSSQGKAVRNLQERLKNLDYFEGTVNGTYDEATAQAVKFAQRKLSMADNGAASDAFQKKLYHSSMPAAGQYVTLKKGDVSQRVYNLVERVINLGYFNGDKLGNKYGDKTAAAMDLFAQVNGLPVPGGIATESIQAAIFDPNAKVNPNPPADNPLAKGGSGGSGGGGSGYSNLQIGSSGSAVTNLQQRLANLGYFEGSVSGTYDDATAQAVKFAQRKLGLTDDGSASASFQSSLFDSSMPAAGQYVTLKKGDVSQRVWNLVDRLINMGYFNGDKLGTKYGDKTVAAIDLFATVNGQPVPGGVATESIQQVLFSSAAIVNPNPPADNPLAKAAPDPDTQTVLTAEERDELTKLMNEAGIQTEEFTHKDAVTWIQQVLSDENYYTGPVNGVYNDKTMKAIEQFAKDYELEAPEKNIPNDSIIQKLRDFA